MQKFTRVWVKNLQPKSKNATCTHHPVHKIMKLLSAHKHIATKSYRTYSFATKLLFKYTRDHQTNMPSQHTQSQGAKGKLHVATTNINDDTNALLPQRMAHMTYSTGISTTPICQQICICNFIVDNIHVYIVFNFIYLTSPHHSRLLRPVPVLQMPKTQQSPHPHHHFPK